MPATVTVFVSYAHEDADYLAEDALLGFLVGLKKEGVEFWDDRRIPLGSEWDEEIKAAIGRAQIALVLVSQAFLDSDYCQNVEITHFLANKAHLIPVILSPCDWEQHDWLKTRQFIPTGQATVETDYRDRGQRKALFLKIRQALHEQVVRARATAP